MIKKDTLMYVVRFCESMENIGMWKHGVRTPLYNYWKSNGK